MCIRDRSRRALRFIKREVQEMAIVFQTGRRRVPKNIDLLACQKNLAIRLSGSAFAHRGAEMSMEEWKNLLAWARSSVDDWVVERAEGDGES